MSDKEIIVYSSSVGGVIVQKNQIAMIQLVGSTNHGCEPECRFIDQIPADEKARVFADRERLFGSDHRTKLPVLFVDGKCIGDQEILVDMNESGLLHEVLGLEAPHRD